jgi:predicted HAD superfamily phosphohydrolase YqeG
METENTFIAQPKTREQESALRAFAKALNIEFVVKADKPYNQDFVKKIKESQEQVKNGKTKSLDLDELWKD